MVGYQFKVKPDVKPMSGSKGKRRYARKKELIDAVIDAKKDELETARRILRGKQVKVSVRFNLQKPVAGVSESVGKKDLDNMLKLVLDSLQLFADTQKKLPGIGLIANDEDVYRIEAVKRIVDRPEQVGIRISVSEFHPEDTNK